MRNSCVWVGTLFVLLISLLSGCNIARHQFRNLSISLASSGGLSTDQGQSVTITATVTGDPSNSGVSWSLTGPGTLSNQTTTSVSYTAPSSVSSPEAATVTATSVAKSSDTAQISLGVYPPPRVTTTSLTAASEYTAYATTLQATGGAGTLTWKVASGSLPAWATFNASTGAISGTPNASGTANFSVAVTDSAGVTSPSQALSLAVNSPPALAITTTSLPGGTAGTAYSTVLQATGGYGAYTWSVSAGSLPAWATLNASTGVINGTPNASGTTNFTIKVTDSEPTPASATAAVSITIAPPPALTIVTTSMPSGVAGTQYSIALQASGGIQPYTWSISSGSLPAWATLDASTGVISGMPNAAGTTNFTVKVTDSESPTVSATQNLTLTVQPAPQLTISTTSLPNGNVGTAYTATLVAMGGVQPYTWSIAGGSLPSWAQLDASTGMISGTPDATGTTTFTVQVTDSSATPVSATQQLSLTINPPIGPNASELNGDYAFLVQGFNDASGNQFAIIGSFTADGKGNITGGIFDVNGPSPATEVPLTGFYTVGADNRGTITLDGTDGSSRTFAIAVGSLNSSTIATKATIIEFDDTSGSGNRGSGTIYVQDTAAFSGGGISGINGPYAFEIAGQESGAGSRLAEIGAFAADGNGNITGGELDANSGGAASNETFTATISSLDGYSTSYGRLGMTLGGGATGNNVLYIVDAARLLIMSTDPESTSGLTAGEVRAQSATSPSLNGTSIIYTTGEDVVDIGSLVFSSSDTSIAATLDENKAGTASTTTATFTYTLSLNGRVVVSGGKHPMIAYLVDSNEGFFLDDDPAVSDGYFYPQAAGPFSNTSVSGNYFFGVTPPAVSASTVDSGVATSPGNGVFTITEDASSTNGLTTGQSLTDNLTIGSNGRVTDSLGDILYIVSSNKIVLINTTDTVPVVTIFQQ